MLFSVRAYYWFLFILGSLTLRSVCEVTVLIKPMSDASYPCSEPCFTLTEYIAIEYRNESNLNLKFLEGHHVLEFTDFTMTDLVGITLTADSDAIVIDCKGKTRFIFNNVSGLVIENITFISCGISSTSDSLPGVSLLNTDQVELTNVTIRNSSAGALFVQESTINITNILLENNRANINGTFSGLMASKSIIYLQGSSAFVQNGRSYFKNFCSSFFPQFIRQLYFDEDLKENVFLALNTTIISNGTLSFINNTSPTAIMAFQSSRVEIYVVSEFVENTVCVSGALFLLNTYATLSGNVTFFNNSASPDIFNAVSGMRVSSDSTLYISGTTSLVRNYADISPIIVSASIVSISGRLVCAENVAFAGILFLTSELQVTGSLHILDNSANRGILNMNDSSVIASASGNISFIRNSASLSSLIVTNTNVRFFGVTSFIDNIGVMYSLNSTVIIGGESQYIRNTGSVLVFFDGVLKMQDTYIFADNRLTNGNGGCIYSSSSSVYLYGNGTFRNNTARLGGALYLQSQSNLFILTRTTLVFDSNCADSGAAIHVVDTVNYDQCTNMVSTLSIRQYCFIEFYNCDNTTCLEFRNNTAASGGSALHGGLLDKCALRNSVNSAALDVFRKSSDFESGNSLPLISSEPFSLCFCDGGVILCRRNEVQAIQVVRGQVFTINIIAFSQTHNSTGGLIRSYLNSLSDTNSVSSLSGQVQTLGDKCTTLNFTISSQHAEEDLFIYADGPCRDIGDATRTIHVTFIDCPVGFSLQSGICVCDERIRSYTNSCDVDTGLIEKRNNNFWTDGYYVNGSYLGLIIYPYCLFEYCSSPPTSFDLSFSDSQCARNHSGMLCGGCKENMSLVLGTSRCYECKDDSYIALMIVFAILGIVFVALLFLLQMTVASGTINGLIYYANIVHITKPLLFSNGSFYIFISWLNLDFGIETCFHNGLNQLAVAAWQFVFPLYLWLLVAIIIIACHFSIRISKIFAGRNPVSVLATIILLSYAKLLKNIIDIFSLAGLHYPNDVTKYVWLLDGNVELFTENTPAFWYILFIVALIALIFIFFPYTFILLTAHFLHKVTNIFHKLNLTPFINAYQAPYKSASRYWTGLTLLLRCFIFVVIGITEELSVNLLVISTLTVCQISIIAATRGIYSNRWIDLLEISFLLNLVALSIVTFHIRAVGRSQLVPSIISLLVFHVTFAIIIIYHITTQLQRSSWFKKMIKVLETKINRRKQSAKKQCSVIEIENVTFHDITVNPASHAVIPLREPLLDDT